MTFRFRDRRQAGLLLAAQLVAYANRPDVLVLTLPGGGGYCQLHRRAGLVVSSAA